MWAAEAGGEWVGSAGEDHGARGVPATTVSMAQSHSGGEADPTGLGPGPAEALPGGFLHHQADPRQGQFLGGEASWASSHQNTGCNKNN